MQLVISHNVPLVERRSPFLFFLLLFLFSCHVNHAPNKRVFSYDTRFRWKTSKKTIQKIRLKRSKNPWRMTYFWPPRSYQYCQFYTQWSSSLHNTWSLIAANSKHTREQKLPNKIIRKRGAAWTIINNNSFLVCLFVCLFVMAGSRHICNFL